MNFANVVNHLGVESRKEINHANDIINRTNHDRSAKVMLNGITWHFLNETKIQVYNSTIRSLTTQGAEVWNQNVELR